MWRCLRFPLKRALVLLACSKLILDISFLVLYSTNLNSLLVLYQNSPQNIIFCEDLTHTSLTTEVIQVPTTANSISETVTSIKCLTNWVVITPFIKILMDIVFDLGIILGCCKKNSGLLRITLAYTLLMAAFHVVGFCCQLKMQLKGEATIIEEYFLSVMPLVALNGWSTSAREAQSWLLWISYVGFLSICLPYMLRKEIQKLERKDDFVVANPAQEVGQSRGILYSPLRQGLLKMLIVKQVVALALVMYLTYFAIGMWKLKVHYGYVTAALALTIPLLIIDAAFNIELYYAYDRRDEGMLRLYSKYSLYVRLMNVVTAVAIKYLDFIFCLMVEEVWVVVLYNFHLYLLLWIVYAVVHFYVEMLVINEIAKLEKSKCIHLVTKLPEVSFATSQTSETDDDD